MTAISEHAYVSTFLKLEKYFHFYLLLHRKEHISVVPKSQILGEARQSYYFRAILYLGCFLKKREHLYIGRLADLLSKKEHKEQLDRFLKYLEENQYRDNLYNLRDKWIAHRDNEYHSVSPDFPDDIFNTFIINIGNIINLSIPGVINFERGISRYCDSSVNIFKKEMEVISKALLM